MKLRSSYRPRSIRFFKLADHDGWKIKVYRIKQQNHSSADTHFLDQVTKLMVRKLPVARTELNHGVGFLIIHQGEHRNWLLLDWWFDQEILKQRLFSSPVDNPEHITEAEPDILACTWEMAVHCFERQAWLDTVLANPEGPEPETYLARTLNAEV